MDNQYIEIKDAIKALRLEREIKEYFNDEKDKIINKIKYKFVSGNPRVWWLSLKYKPKNFIYTDNYQYRRIGELLNEEECFFIPELEDIHVFETKVQYVIKIIENSSFFEYYIVNKSITKFLCETDHGDFLFININDLKE